MPLEITIKTNIIPNGYDEIKCPLSKAFRSGKGVVYTCNLLETCIQEAVLPESLEVTKVVPVFKNGDSENQE